MSEITPDNERFIRDLLAEGRYKDRGEVLNEAVRLLRDNASTIDAIQEGLDSIGRGEGRPLKEVDADLRSRHGIPKG